MDGFAQRSGIKVNLDMPPELGRLGRDVETALFRALQETLTNVHRHAGCSEVHILLGLDAEQVQLEVKDNGRGIPKERLQSLRETGSEAGVGLAGMRQRVQELGGSLEILSDPTGTAVIVTIPIADNQEDSPRRISA